MQQFFEACGGSTDATVAGSRNDFWRVLFRADADRSWAGTLARIYKKILFADQQLGGEGSHHRREGHRS